MAAGLYDCPWPENELLPQRVDRLGRVTPEAPFAEFPLSTTYDEGYYRVTYGILANAVNGLAWWFESTLGHERNGKVLAYIGPNDLRYTALTLGAVKAGYLVSIRVLGLGFWAHSIYRCSMCHRTTVP